MPLDIQENGSYSIPVIPVTMRALSIIMKQLESKRVAALKMLFNTTLIYGAIWSLADLWEYFDALSYPTEENNKAIVNELMSMNDDGFPNLQQMFDFNINNNNATNPKIAKMIRALTGIRTDLDHFYDDESEILQALGYTLCAMRMRIKKVGMVGPGLNFKAVFTGRDKWSAWFNRC